MYPGYEPDEVTPLPEPLQAKEIILTVMNAQWDLRKKVKDKAASFYLKTLSLCYLAKVTPAKNISLPPWIHFPTVNHIHG